MGHAELVCRWQEIKDRCENARNPIDSDLLSSFETLGPLGDKPDSRAILTLHTRGCSWFRKKGGGCFHCGLVGDNIWNPNISSGEMIRIFLAHLSRINFAEYPILCVYTPGSFFDDREIDPQARQKILIVLSQIREIKKLVFESKAEFLSYESISNLRDIIPDKQIEIGIGLDSSKAEIRRLCINKGTPQRMYEKALENLKKSDVDALMYVLIKPPFLTEEEAIEDAVLSTKDAFQMGADFVSLEPISVQRSTFVEYLLRHGFYRPPWLWSVIEVVRRTHLIGKLRIGVEVVYPAAIARPMNCGKCTKEVLTKLRKFNATRNMDILLSIRCDCRAKWTQELDDIVPLSIPERIKRVFELNEVLNE